MKLVLALVYLVALIVGGIGWVWNIIKLIALVGGDINVELVLRVVGIFVAPFGAIFGYF